MIMNNRNHHGLKNMVMNIFIMKMMILKSNVIIRMIHSRNETIDKISIDSINWTSQTCKDEKELFDNVACYFSEVFDFVMIFGNTVGWWPCSY